jgi:hypothetical protein
MYHTRKFIAAALAAVFVLTFSSCSTDINSWVPAGMKEISQDIVDYNLFIPTDWTSDQSSGVVTAYVSSSDRSSISMISFDLDNPNQTLSDFWNERKEGFTSFFTDMSYETEGEAMLLGGIAANKYVYTANASGLAYKFMQIICINKGTVYIFTYSATSDKYETHLQEAQNIIEHFSFK